MNEFEAKRCRLSEKLTGNGNEKKKEEMDATNVASDPMSIEIQSFFDQNSQRHSTLERKYKLAIALKKIVQESLRDSYSIIRLFMVGSSVNGFGVENSDLDFSVQVPTHYDTDEWFDVLGVDQEQLEINHRDEALYVLGLIKTRLLSSGECCLVKLVEAKVPILKFMHISSGIEVDINCNNTVSIRNSHLLRYYSQMDHRVRPLAMAIKSWAQKNGINDPKRNTLSSYSLVLMVINYLQAGVKPSILPSLQNCRPLMFKRKQSLDNLTYGVDTQLKSSSNTESLSQLFIGFLKYYDQFHFDKKVISVRTGATISLENLMLTHRNKDSYNGHYLYVEEPFNRTNTAVAIYDSDMWNRIRTAFHNSYNRIMSTKSFSRILEADDVPETAPKPCGRVPFRELNLNESNIQRPNGFLH